jgi:glutathione S-transferase
VTSVTLPAVDGRPILFYTPGACSLAVQVALLWSGVPHILCRVPADLRVSEAYRQINTRGQVPALRTGDGRLLSENACILQHVADQNASAALAPEVGTAARDDFNQWLSYLGSGFHVAFYPLFMPARYTNDEAGRDAVRQAALRQIETEFNHVENRLAHAAPWLLANHRTVLDPYLYAMARWAPPDLCSRERFPLVNAFMERLSADASVREALSIERSGILPPGTSAPIEHLVFGRG